jgi:AcrR family transcriptional regulator
MRRTIALTARDLFIAEGNTSATVERICDIVGIAPRTFHRHFPVKEDVLSPLFRQSELLVIDILRTAPADADPVEVLARAFTVEVGRRDVPEFDRKFMDLMINNPPYRLRWLEWGEGLCGEITEYLARHYELSPDPFLRALPAHLAMQTMRQAYIHWVGTSQELEFAGVEQHIARGLRLLLAGLTPAATAR